MVYFAADSECVKIGFTRGQASIDVALKRIRVLQIGNPRLLSLIGLMDGGIKEEAEWHSRYAIKKVTGEWFLLSAEEITEISYGLPGIVLNSLKQQTYKEFAYDPKLESCTQCAMVLVSGIIFKLEQHGIERTYLRACSCKKLSLKPQPSIIASDPFHE